MKNIKEQAQIWVHFGGPFLIWVALLLFTSSELKINAEALKKLPDAVTIYVIILFVFTKWAWKWPVFRGWLVPFPNLQGTWEGTLKSTWKNEEGETLPPIPMILVIKQTFSSISCVLYTQESNSYSTTAQINEDDSSGVLRLTYNYTNRSQATIRDRSPIHDGAAILRISEKPELCLEGEYWTSRQTTGDIKLTFKSRELLQGFPNQQTSNTNQTS